MAQCRSPEKRNSASAMYARTIAETLGVRTRGHESGRPHWRLSQRERLDLLAAVPWFEKVEMRSLAGLALSCSERAFRAGETVFEAGEVGEAMFIVVEGSISIELANETIAELGPRQCFGELAVVDGGERSAFARASSDVVVCEISREALFEMMKQDIEIARGVFGVLGQRLRSLLEEKSH